MMPSCNHAKLALEFFHANSASLKLKGVTMKTEVQKPQGNMSPSQTADRFIVRFHDEGMRKTLKVRAASNERTLNAEIVYLIKRGLQAEQAQGAQQ